MARKPKTTPPVQPSSPPLGSIRDYHELGTKFLNATGGERSPRKAEELAEKYNCSEVGLYKARQFARMYSQDELEELCSLGESEGHPLGIGHVHQLIQVKATGERKRLQAAAAKNGWSSRKLKEMRKQKLGYEVVTNLGRKPRRAAGVDEALLQLAQRADQWKRWVEALSPAGDDRTTEFDLGELSDTVRDKLKAVTNAARELAETLERVIQKRNSQKPLRKKKR